MVGRVWNGLPRDGRYGAAALQSAFLDRTVLIYMCLPVQLGLKLKVKFALQPDIITPAHLKSPSPITEEMYSAFGQAPPYQLH